MSEKYTVSVIYGAKLSTSQVKDAEAMLKDQSLEEWAEAKKLKTITNGDDLYIGLMIDEFDSGEPRVIGCLRSEDFTEHFKTMQFSFYNRFKKLEVDYADLYIIGKAT